MGKQDQYLVGAWETIQGLLLLAVWYLGLAGNGSCLTNLGSADWREIADNEPELRLILGAEKIFTATVHGVLIILRLKWTQKGI